VEASWKLEELMHKMSNTQIFHSFVKNSVISKGNKILSTKPLYISHSSFVETAQTAQLTTFLGFIRTSHFPTASTY